MTIHPKLIEALKQEFPPGGFIDDASMTVLPPYTSHPAWACDACKPEQPCDAHKNHFEVIIRDAASDLYLNFGTFADLVRSTNELDEFLLQKPGVQGLIYVMDQGTPATKAANRAKDDKGNVPKTPFEEFATTTAWQAWKKYFDAYYTNPNTVSASLTEFTQSTASLPYVRYTRPPNWADYMKNRDFKEFVSQYLCDSKFRTMKVPAGKWLVVMGPSGVVKKRTAFGEVQPELFYSKPYKEADYMTVWLANNLHRRYHVTIYSRDGDTWLANLLSCTRRILDRGDGTIDSINFGGNVIVVRNWQTRGKFSFVDVNTLWRTIQQHAGNLASHITAVPNFRFDQAVSTYVFLLLMLNNDYVEGFPQLTPDRILTAVRTNLGSIGLPLLTGAGSTETLRIDCSSVMRVFLFAYQAKYPKMVIDTDDLDTTLHNIGERLGSHKNKFTIPKFKVALANAYWFMLYMIAAQTGALPPSGLEVVKVGEETFSKYGYVHIGGREEIIRNYTGVPSVVHADDVDLSHLSMQSSNKTG